MKKLTAAIAGATAGAFSTLAMAHPGHEHGTAGSVVLHVVTVLALVGAGAVAVHMVRRHRRNATIKAANEKGGD